jgi:transcriptional regulator with XRE-family HTH domain
MNLHTLPPLDEAPAVTAGDEVARVLDAAKIATEPELLDAIESRRVQLGLSLASLDRLSGLAVGHASKVLSPARTKPPTVRTLYRLLDAVALSIVLVVDGAKAARISTSWKPRAEEKVRVRELSPTTLRRARPTILAELSRKAARPRWAGIDALTFMRAMTGDET